MAFEFVIFYNIYIMTDEEKKQLTDQIEALDGALKSLSSLETEDYEVLGQIQAVKEQKLRLQIKLINAERFLTKKALFKIILIKYFADFADIILILLGILTYFTDLFTQSGNQTLALLPIIIPSLSLTIRNILEKIKK